MEIAEAILLERLEKSRESYQAALIDLRLAEERMRAFQNADTVQWVSSTRRQFSAATRDYQDALTAFTEFTLQEPGKHTKAVGST